MQAHARGRKWSSISRGEQRHVSRGVSRSDERRVLFTGVAAALALSGCAGGYIFTRPSAPAAELSIKNEASGKTYSDCRKAFAEANADTVLTFSAGVFPCGTEVSAATDWLVVRGAGLGHTFLVEDETLVKPPESPHLAALRPRKFLRVEDIAFGGLTALPGEEGRAELIRDAITTTRPALIGGPGAAMEGSALIVHSILAGWGSSPPASKATPKPLALAGNEKVALIESIALDVEQEFERYPAPGSIVLLSPGVQVPFAKHDPGAASRPDPSGRQNVPCGNVHNPIVACASEGPPPQDATPLATAARNLWAGGKLAAVEPLLRQAGKGFEKRFEDTLGRGIRQPDVFWFDNPEAQVLEDESQLQGWDAVNALAKGRTAAVVERCGAADQSGASIAAAMTTARKIDHLLNPPSAEATCKDRLQARINALVDACKQSWDWAQVLTGVDSVDIALASGHEQSNACKKVLISRLPDPATRGQVVDAYVRALGKTLQLGLPSSGGEPIPSVAPAVKVMPWILTRAGRALPPAASPGVLDHIIKAAQSPEGGDGRKLIEITGPCIPAGSGKSVRATTTVRLGELLANAKTGQEPHIVVEIPVTATGDDLKANYEGSRDAALIARCEEKTAAVYDAAIRDFVVHELEQAVDANTDRTGDLQVLLQLVRLEQPEPKQSKASMVPWIPSALAQVADAIKRQSMDLPPGGGLSRDDSPLLLRPPPDWAITDFVLAVDQLARSGTPTLEGCTLAMPDVPWARQKDMVVGPVQLQGQSTLIHCAVKGSDYELSAWPDKTAKINPVYVDTILKGLVPHMNWPKAKATPKGETMTWPPAATARSGAIYTHAKAGSELLELLVPMGSKWAK